MLIEISHGFLSGFLKKLQCQTGINIFSYHGIVPSQSDKRLQRNFHLVSNFQSHIRFLKYFRNLSLEELSGNMGSPWPLNQRIGAITFDDCYANNLKAAEILKRYHFPWTLFVSTGAVGRDKSIWTLELSLLLLQGEATHLEVLDKIWNLNMREAKEAAFQTIRYAMKAMPDLERRQTLEIIRSQFPKGETKRLLEKSPSLQMLTWNEIRQLANDGVEIGSHGVDH